MNQTHRLWTRRYSVPAVPFWVTTADGVRIQGHRLGRGRTAVVFCHGFLGWHRKGRLVEFQQRLARRCAVYAFDFRGHGQSGGVSAFGVDEYLDVDAVIGRARADGFRRVVTFGASMGGIAVIRQAAFLGHVDGVVAVSTPARWDGHDSQAVRRMARLAGTSRGRWLLRAWGTRVPADWTPAEDPAGLGGGSARIALVIVHGRDDHYFDEEQAWLLYRKAGEPKRLLLAAPFGHAEDGFTAGFAARLASVLAG